MSSASKSSSTHSSPVSTWAMRVAISRSSASAESSAACSSTHCARRSRYSVIVAVIALTLCQLYVAVPRTLSVGGAVRRRCAGRLDDEPPCASGRERVALGDERGDLHDAPVDVPVGGVRIVGLEPQLHAGLGEAHVLLALVALEARR